MKAVIQRVSSASVIADGIPTGDIAQGYMILLGVVEEDTEAHARVMAEKVANLRIFTDENDKMNLSLLDIKGEALVVSNFTLCADTSHGRRPSFIGAKKPVEANTLYELFMAELKKQGVTKVASGVFGADMKVTIENDGPVTILLNTDDWKIKA
ncbi:MAG: D-tyrosyl-tRNA(Tyr) deacylase [Clostridia bacterium]|nr:D-tyrosyl-tRNA(Tyr) deacylase [Clostridia bacterium]